MLRIFGTQYWRRLGHRGASLRVSSAPYLSGDTFRDYCRHQYGDVDDAVFKPSKVCDGDFIFCKAERLREFFLHIAPGIGCSFRLISGNSDENIDSSFSSLIPPLMDHWFCQNQKEWISSRVSPLPIGLENLHYRKNGLVSDFELVRTFQAKRELKVLYNFSVHTNPNEREPAREVLSRAPTAKSEMAEDPFEYRRMLLRYAFVASPPGNGLDCHRTWEALYLGCFPVVKRCYFTEYFEAKGLPLVLIDKWEEVLSWDDRYLGELRDRLADRSETSLLWFGKWREFLIGRF